MRKNIERLIKLMNDGTVTAYKVSKDTGVSQTQLSRLRAGKSNINNISFEVAQILSRYYESNFKKARTIEDVKHYELLEPFMEQVERDVNRGYLDAEHYFNMINDVTRSLKYLNDNAPEKIDEIESLYRVIETAEAHAKTVNDDVILSTASAIDWVRENFYKEEIVKTILVDMNGDYEIVFSINEDADWDFKELDRFTASTYTDASKKLKVWI